MGKTKKGDYPTAYSGGTQKLPEAHFIRFTEAQHARLHEVKRETGQTIQGFLHNAAILALDEHDRLRAERTEHRRAYTGESPLPKNQSPLSERPRGMGLRGKLAAIYSSSDEEMHEEVVAAPAALPQIVINNGPQAAGISQIDSLAMWIMKAPVDKQDVRLRSAVEILEAGAKDDAERRQFALALDEKLAALGKKKKEFSPLGVFNVIDSFLKG